MSEESTAGRRAAGARRRQSLIAAGIGVVQERGWAGLTTRAVAEEAEANQGLVHYYFGGLPGLKREVAAAAIREAFDPVLEALVGEPTWQAGMASVIGHAASNSGVGSARVSAELVAASLQDPQVAALVQDALRGARERLVPWLQEMGEDQPEGLAILIVAALDGLLLHRLVDPSLPLLTVAAAASAIADPPGPGGHGSQARRRARPGAGG